MKIIKISSVPGWESDSPVSVLQFVKTLQSKTYYREFCASLVNNNAKGKMWDATIDLDTDDMRSVLCMTNTTADTEDDVATTSAFSTLDENDATGYARIALTSEAVNVDTGNNRAEFDAADLSFTSLSGDATRATQGCLIHEHITNDSSSLPVVFVDFSSDLPTTATQIDVPWDAQGIMQAT